MFEFEHTFEIYKPQDARTYGYWVMPLLAEGRLCGRADLKLDRSDRRLLVKGLWLERDAADAHAAGALRTLAAHVGADDIEIQRTYPALRRAPVQRCLTRT